jgi:purine-binding chemotaxis protein CheW
MASRRKPNSERSGGSEPDAQARRPGTPTPAATGVAAEQRRAATLDSALTPLAKPGQYLVFPIASETYALSVQQAHEILEYRVPTLVPGAPPWIDGILNLRGSVVPLVDLATKFGTKGRGRHLFVCIIVIDLRIDLDLTQVGVVVDAVPNVVDLSVDQIAEPPLFGTMIHVRYLSGMATLDGRLALVLDADSALNAEEVEILSHVLDDIPADQIAGA